jgi:hypothetical protein
VRREQARGLGIVRTHACRDEVNSGRESHSGAAAQGDALVLALIQAHLAEGNLVEGLRIYESYRDLVQRELGIEPGASILALLRREGEHGGCTIRARTPSAPQTQPQRQGRTNEKNGYRVQAVTLVVALLGVLGSPLSGVVDDYFQDYRRSLIAEPSQSHQMFINVPNEFEDIAPWNAPGPQSGPITIPGHKRDLTAASEELSLAVNVGGILLQPAAKQFRAA